MTGGGQHGLKKKKKKKTGSEFKSRPSARGITRTQSDRLAQFRLQFIQREIWKHIVT